MGRYFAFFFPLSPARLREKGFTLVELLVVLLIVGIFAVALIAALNPLQQIEKAKDAQRQHDLSQIHIALDSYYNDNTKYPSALDKLAPKYITQIPLDPDTHSEYPYIADTNNTPPQWSIVFAKLSVEPTSCKLPPGCQPQRFYNASYACVISGAINQQPNLQDCTYIQSQSLP